MVCKSSVIFLFYNFTLKITLVRIVCFMVCLFCLLGCANEQLNREHGQELCRALFRVGITEAYCDSIVFCSRELPVAMQVDVLLEAVRSDIGGNYQKKVKDWLEEAIQITPREKAAEVEMERFRYYFRTEWQRMDPIEREQEREKFVRLEEKYHLTSRQRAWYLFYKADIFARLNMLDSWIWMREALQLAKKEKMPVLQVRILEKFSNIALWGGDYDLAISNWKQAYQIRQREGLYTDRWEYWSRLQNYRFQAKRYSEVLEGWQELLRDPQAYHDPQNVIKILRNLVKVYQTVENLPDALRTLKELEGMEKSLFLKIGVWKDMAEIFQAQGETDSAGLYYRKAVETWEHAYPTRTLFTLFPAYSGYAHDLWEQGHKQEAIRLLEKATIKIPAFTVSEEAPVGGVYLKPYLKLVLQLSEYYRTAGKPALAMKMLFIRDSLRDRFAESDVWYKEMELTERYRNQELKVQLHFRDEQLRVRKRMLQGVVLLCVALAGIILMLWKLYRQKQHRLDDIYRKQKQLEQLEYRVSTLEVENPESQLFRRLEQLVVGQQLFRRPELSLDELCGQVGSNRTYVSACVNKEAGMNFNSWINKIRIDDVLKAIRAGERDLTDLYVAAGFASQTSFYRNFKLVTQMTPKQYLEREKRTVNE